MLWIELSETKIDGLKKKSIDEEQAKMEISRHFPIFITSNTRQVLIPGVAFMSSQ